LTAYLGFSCSQHDPSIAVVSEDGDVLFAEANERALKCKRGWHAPPDAFGVIEPVLHHYVRDDEISANLTWSAGALRTTRPLSMIARLSVAALEKAKSLDAMLWQASMFRHALYRAPASATDLLLNLEIRLRERNGLRFAFRKQAWQHHLCHAATACYSSPFDDALCVVVDGMGEGSSTSVFAFRDGEIRRLDRRGFSNIASLGVLYSQICFAAGFDPHAGEEWKLMGLAAYGKLDEALYQNIRSVLKVNGQRLAFSRSFPSVMRELMGSRAKPNLENADLAFTAQKVFEDVLFEFLNAAYRKWGGENLIFTGGCALNSSANGKILSSTPFGKLHVPAAPGDDGNSVGAALLAWKADHPGRPVPRFSTPYLGSEHRSSTLSRLGKHGMKPDFVASNEDELSDHVAKDLAAGAIAGWMQGRAEFGHRALGNRSILADPRPEGIRDRLNAAVKFREEFRPFAPSILHEFGPDYFENYEDSPYMERTLKWLPGRAPPGVCHVDNTGRLQSVTSERNPRFHGLISAFHRYTGLPILLNTSFNVMGRPMVHDIEDALGVFFTSDIDLLVVGNEVFRKQPLPERQGYRSPDQQA
jgi:carbamoyltransferase